MELSAREIKESDIPLILKYWFESSNEYLLAMGADPAKLPSKESFREMLELQISAPYTSKLGYATIWEIEGIPSGHCNIGNIKYGKEATMHLHLWQAENRKKGMGHNLVKKSLPFFFNNFKIKKLISEPYALNPAPNKTLPKLGFEFIKIYHTTPGSINLPQEVKRYELSYDSFLKSL